MSSMVTPATSEATAVKKPGGRKRRRLLGWLFNVIILALLAGLGWLFYQAEQKRAQVEAELQRTASQLEELRRSSQNSGQQVAAEVLDKVRKHIDLPMEPAPTVATVTDIERLRKANAFYNKAENGDHLIITEGRAILYDPERDIILDVVPVRTNTTPSGSPGPTASGSPTVPPTGSPAGSPSASATPRP